MKNPYNLLVGTLVLVSLNQTTLAGSATWNGGMDAIWAADTNWSPTTIPGSGDTSTFNNAGGVVDVIDLGESGVTIGNIIFDGASVAPYTIGSGAAATQLLTLNNGGAISSSNTIAANQIFNARLSLGTDADTASYSIINNSGTNSLAFPGGITGTAGEVAGNKTLNVSASPLGSGGVILSGAISDGGANSLALAFSAVSGTVQVNLGNSGNSYSGGTSIASGVRLNASTGNSLGSGPIAVASGGQLYLNSQGVYTNSFTIGGVGTDSAGAIRMGNGTTNTINGDVTLSANSRIAVDSSKFGVINGTITGAFSFDKNSAGTLTLAGPNDYSGGTTINGGTVALSGSGTLGATTGALTFNGNTTALNLNGTTQTVASFSGGIVSANHSGSITGVDGTLNVTGNFSYQGGSTTSGSYTTHPTLTVNTDVAVGQTTFVGRSTLLISGGTLTTDRITSNAAGSKDFGRVVISGADVTATNGVNASYGTDGSNGTTTSFQLELNGGTLSTSAIRVSNRDISPAGPNETSDSNLIWNGGTLKIIGGNNANLVQVFGDTGNPVSNRQATYVSSGGAVIDTNGFDIGIQVKLLENPSSTGGGLTKSGAGTLTLSGANTYTGNTTVSAGTLELAATIGSLKFVPTTNGVSNKITGTGTLALKGIFNIDLSGAAATPGNSWTLVDVATLSETFDSTFSVTDFTESADVWTKPDGANVWTFRESTGVLTYSVAAGYTSWIDTPAFGLTAGQKGESADPDNDGTANLLEFVLNGNPSVSDPSILPELNVTTTDFEFTYNRRDDSLTPETIQTFQYGTDLSAWTSVVVPADSDTVGAATITVTDGTPADTVKISIPKSSVSPSTKLFGRLQIIK